MENRAKNIIKFLKERPLIHLPTLDRTCGMAESTLKKVFNGERNLPLKYVSKLEKELIIYGFNPI